MKYKVSELEHGKLIQATKKAEWKRICASPVLTVVHIGDTTFLPDESISAALNSDSFLRLVHREGISLQHVPPSGGEAAFWAASICDERKQVSDHEGGTSPTYYQACGPFPRVAALRAFIISQFGEEIEL